MTPDDSETTSTERVRMVERQLRRRGITDERVLTAMETVPRELFLPEGQRKRAYRDGAVRIGEGQTMSQPWIVACMAQLLELDGSETVLEVGTGSGYAAAVLSLLRARGRDDRALRAPCRRGAQPCSPSSATTTWRCARATARWARPIARRSAESRSRPPRATSHRAALFDQLAAGGALVCPVERGRRELLVRFRDGEEEAVAAVRFVPLLRGPVQGD